MDVYFGSILYADCISLQENKKEKKDSSEFVERKKKNEETDFCPKRWLFSDLEELHCY